MRFAIPSNQNVALRQPASCNRSVNTHVAFKPNKYIQKLKIITCFLVEIINTLYIFCGIISIYVQLLRIFSFLNNQKRKIKPEAALNYSGRIKRSKCYRCVGKP